MILENIDIFPFGKTTKLERDKNTKQILYKAESGTTHFVIWLTELTKKEKYIPNRNNILFLDLRIRTTHWPAFR